MPAKRRLSAGNLRHHIRMPYHTLGVHKYQQMGVDYPLAGVQPLEQKDAERARSVILAAFREKKKSE